MLFKAFSLFKYLACFQNFIIFKLRTYHSRTIFMYNRFNSSHPQFIIQTLKSIMKRELPSLADPKTLKQPPKLTISTLSKVKSLVPANPSQPQNQQIRQTPHFIYHQPPAQSPLKTPLSKKIKSINHQSVISVNSINMQQPTLIVQNSEVQSGVMNLANRDAENRPTMLNQYLSITSLPDEFQYRPSKNSINKMQHNYSFEEEISIDKCQQCEYQGEMDKIYKMGWVAWSWMVFLILSTLVFFFIPLVVKSYQQKQLICPECGYKVKTETPTCL